MPFPDHCLLVPFHMSTTRLQIHKVTSLSIKSVSQLKFTIIRVLFIKDYVIPSDDFVTSEMIIFFSELFANL